MMFIYLFIFNAWVIYGVDQSLTRLVQLPWKASSLRRSRWSSALSVAFLSYALYAYRFYPVLMHSWRTKFSDCGNSTFQIASFCVISVILCPLFDLGPFSLAKWAVTCCYLFYCSNFNLKHLHWLSFESMQKDAYITSGWLRFIRDI